MKPPPQSDRIDPVDWMAQSGVSSDVLKALDRKVTQRKRRRIGGAGLALLALVSLILWQRPWSGSATESSTAFVHAPASRQLADGSMIELKENAQVAVAFTDSIRRVELLAGEAHFQVAKDPTKPFIVVVGNLEVRAVGTAFSVNRTSANVEVVVAEGRVAVDRPVQSSSVMQPATLATLDAGDRTVVDLSAAIDPIAPQVEALAPPELRERLSWRVPRLEFTGTPLDEAIPMINRHSPVKLVLGDSSLGSVRLSGILRADNVDALRELLSESAGIHSEFRSETEIVLTRR